MPRPGEDRSDVGGAAQFQSDPSRFPQPLSATPAFRNRQKNESGVRQKPVDRRLPNAGPAPLDRIQSVDREPGWPEAGQNCADRDEIPCQILLEQCRFDSEHSMLVPRLRDMRERLLAQNGLADPLRSDDDVGVPCGIVGGTLSDGPFFPRALRELSPNDRPRRRNVLRRGRVPFQEPLEGPFH